MDRATLLRLWDESWTTGLFAAPWSKAIDGLTPQQAAWHPAGTDGKPRKSIWQNLTHVTFWRNYLLHRVRGAAEMDPVAVEAANWPEPHEVSERAWKDAREHLKASHDAIRAAIADEATPLDRIMYMLPHDAYHLGQVMYIRAMLGLPVIE